DNFAFRNATPFIDLRAGVPTSIDIAPKNSASADESLYNLTTTLENKSYILVANGIVSPSGYEPATPFNIYVYDMAMETAPEGKTNVMVFHGATDAPTVDVVETSVPAGTIIDDMAYGEFTGYLELGTMDYILDVRDETGSTTVASYSAPLQTLGLGGSALTVLASGFLNPAVNSDGPAFGLYVALPSGGELVELPVNTSTSVQSVTDVALKTYPNPIHNSFTLQSNKPVKQIEIYNLSGKQVYTKMNVLSRVIRISSEELKSGYYMLNVQYEDNSRDTMKLIKE
ncbi:T9SS type A sorting domain-containing protein, partial [Saccharicrinis sp. FJH54]|uniref:T9SS type A sorting domain-containing protein n=1 Tax=Saccharicrinis sp. FJH54 TaxID=3344665 RepID=UPI0035D41CAB